MKPLRIALATLGLATIGYGLWGALFTGTQPLRHFAFLAGLIVAHDLILLPIVLAIGWLLARNVPPPARATVQGGLVVSLAVTLMAVPLVLGFGRRADDPSALPGNYAIGLLTVLAAVWAGVLAILLIRQRKETKP